MKEALIVILPVASINNSSNTIDKFPSVDFLMCKIPATERAMNDGHRWAEENENKNKKNMQKPNMLEKESIEGTTGSSF